MMTGRRAHTFLFSSYSMAERLSLSCSSVSCAADMAATPSCRAADSADNRMLRISSMWSVVTNRSVRWLSRSLVGVRAGQE